VVIGESGGGVIGALFGINMIRWGDPTESAPFFFIENRGIRDSSWDLWSCLRYDWL